MPNNIFARSPFIIEINEAGQTSSKVELYIWNGTGSAPASPTYTLSKNIPSTTNLQTTYNISPYIREKISFNDARVLSNFTALTNTLEWCNVKVKRFKNTGTLLDTTEYIAYDGYGYNQEGYNPDLGNASLIQGSFYFQSEIDVIKQDMIRLYLTSGTEINWTTEDGNTSNDFISADGIYDIPTIENWNNNGAVSLNILQITPSAEYNYKFIPIDECKYTPVVIDFVNKQGAWQRLWFLKASYNSIETSGNEYNLLNTDLVNYDILEGQRKVFNINGTESIKVNTGWVDDSYAELLQQLLLSERILVDSKPAKVKTQSLDKQKQINTKMINYSLDFQFAYDIINSVI